ncbi:MAG: hypothetical protein LBF77_11455, partial [Spirochaetaceae bacterium]|nr:hypothetical protein [Spirochaetaceae bacterium]
MKRCFLSIIALFFSAALTFAQTGPRNQGQFPPGTNPGLGQFQNVATIQGALSFINGQIAVKSGETTYYVRGLDRLFGFVDGLKEGAAVTLEGYAGEIPSVPEYKYFLAEKLTFNGKEYAGLLPEKRMGHAFSGGPGFPRGSSPGFPPPAGMMHNRRHSRRLPPSY